MRTVKRAAVIGGGISGLASAHRIAERGHRLALFEAEDFLGGLGTTFPYRGGDLERFYHCLLPTDEALLRFVHELGLGDELLWREARMGFMVQGKTYSLNTPLDLLRFTPLRLGERLRLGGMAVFARFRGSRPDLDDVTAADWVRGMVGERAFELIWKPLLAAKIGDSYPALPALWLSSRLQREKNTEKERKGCLVRGYRSLIDAFEASLRDRGAEIRLKTRVRSLEREPDGMALVLDDGSREVFDYVVSTSPFPVFRGMTGSLELDPRVSGLDLDYQGVVSGVFLLDAPLSSYYWTPFVDSGATAQGVVEMSNLVPLERSGGRWVSYFVNYTHRDGELFARSDDELLGLYRRDLENLFPDSGARVLDQLLFRAPFVEPIWTVGYNERKPPTTLIPGRLYWASTAHLYPRVNSWNSCCELVEELIPELMAQTS